jgi:hypothetical protein
MADQYTNEQLNQRGQTLAPDELRSREHSKAVDIVSRALHLCTRRSTDGTKVVRVKKGGSLAKKTSLYTSDADIVVFVDNTLHPERLPPQAAADLLVRFEVVLKREAQQLLVKERKGHVLKLRYKEVDIDLLVAREFAQKPWEQACSALSFIQELPADEQNRYSVCRAVCRVHLCWRN